MSENENHGKFYFVGNLLWLDFVNTEIVADGQAVDLLANDGDFADWLRYAGVITEADADLFSRMNAEALADVRTFRRTLRSLAAAISEGATISEETIAAINVWLARRKVEFTLEKLETGYAKTARSLWENALDSLAPIAESAADLLADGDFALLRKCENPQCVLYFYDTTKNHARRWCSMSGCGNRHKVAAHYQRKKKVAGG